MRTTPRLLLPLAGRPLATACQPTHHHQPGRAKGYSRPQAAPTRPDVPQTRPGLSAATRVGGTGDYETGVSAWTWSAAVRCQNPSWM